jgi:hypothetical protein
MAGRHPEWHAHLLSRGVHGPPGAGHHAPRASCSVHADRHVNQWRDSIDCRPECSPTKAATSLLRPSDDGAGDETRTREIQLGRHIHESEFRIAVWPRRSTLLQLLTNGRHWGRLSAAFSTAVTERPRPGGRTWHRGPTAEPSADRLDDGDRTGNLERRHSTLGTGVRLTTNPTTPLCARPNNRVRQSGSGPLVGEGSMNSSAVTRCGVES